ncbi:substrate-binding domain-containing protein [Streptomyces sp. NPDC020607]|uniref:substrate-binding domain-containing protein n=1 Tax=Streptomyces sp. NPDC020607 TaxID=3365082 RepID=UPI00379123C6
MRVPRDLSVVGFDVMPVTVRADPPLTTVRQPLSEMAVSAAELGLALGRGEGVPQLVLEIATQLVVRQSTARPQN